MWLDVCVGAELIGTFIIQIRNSLIKVMLEGVVVEVMTLHVHFLEDRFYRFLTYIFAC